jgi:hypothetical protein
MFIAQIGTLRLLSIIFAIAAMGTAIVAATYWFKSASSPPPDLPEPVASIGDAPAEHAMIAVANAVRMKLSLAVSARLNKRAAIWTGISAILGALSTLLGLRP